MSWCSLTLIYFDMWEYHIAIHILAQPKMDLMDKINLQVLKITSMFMIKIYISLPETAVFKGNYLLISLSR